MPPARGLSLGMLVVFGVGLMTPIIVLGTFGILAQSSAGRTPLAYLIALAAMLPTALSYAQMARAHPVAGSSYFYVRKAVDARLGFLTGWAILLDYLFLPMAIWLIGAAYLHSAVPAVPQAAWLLAFVATTTLINVIGLRFAAGLNALLVAVQSLVLVAFVALCIHYTLGDPRTPLFTLAPLRPAAGGWPPILGAAAIACYSYLGFDAVSTLSEETRDPRRNMPAAVVLVALIGGIVFIGTAYFVQVAHPAVDFADADAAAYEIARSVGNDLFVLVFLAGLVVGQFASGIAAQASASRLLYAMGRDGVLPPRFFGRLSPRFGTPVFPIALCAVVALLALKLDVTTSTSFINFGAFLTFILVNLSVVRHYWFGERRRGLGGTLLYLACPVFGMFADAALLVSLDHRALVLGLCWLAVGIAWLARLTGGFRRPPPEFGFAEAA
jgi:amino acid transporter